MVHSIVNRGVPDGTSHFRPVGPVKCTGAHVKSHKSKRNYV
jgi:hypothetical protein